MKRKGTCKVLGLGNYSWVEDIEIPNDTISSGRTMAKIATGNHLLLSH